MHASHGFVEFGSGPWRLTIPPLSSPKKPMPTTKETTKEPAVTTKEPIPTTKEPAKEPAMTTKESRRATSDVAAGSRGRIVLLLSESPNLTAEQLGKRLGITPDGVRYHLKALRKDGVIRHEGSTKAGRWIVLKKENNDA